MITYSSKTLGESKESPLDQYCLSTENVMPKEKETLEQLLLLQTQQNTSRVTLKESSFITAARSRSYSNWPHFMPTREIMSANGWYYCNISDRVICIYCNTICHGWISKDDPYEVHATLAPNCPFVLKLASASKAENCPPVITQSLEGNLQPLHNDLRQISQREKTFNDIGWNHASPSVTDLARAGFYCFNKDMVICFYCGGALHNWSSTDNPMVEHARWFPKCLYAKHLCGAELHFRIQKRQQQLSIKNITDEEISRFVTARLDLPIIKYLRTKYQLAVIRKCIENQYKKNLDDFASPTDLALACLIYQKQVDLLKDGLNKIIIPSQTEIQVHSNEKLNVKLKDCIVCCVNERQLVCLPCGHLCTCVPCGYALESCPLCRQIIQSFFRIYV